MLLLFNYQAKEQRERKRGRGEERERRRELKKKFRYQHHLHSLRMSLRVDKVIWSKNILTPFSSGCQGTKVNKEEGLASMEEREEKGHFLLDTHTKADRGGGEVHPNCKKDNVINVRRNQENQKKNAWSE